MAADWNNQPKLEGAPSIVFNEAGVTFNDILYNFNGQLLTAWNNQQKS